MGDGRLNGLASGAVVLGGDYQGLGIVRSLGRRGVPVVVIDDEPSIARFSRYTSHAVRVRDLRDHDRSVDGILRTGARLGLRGWVLYPTRDEIVEALALHRDRLRSFFRVPTPAWETVRCAWDKRETNAVALRLGIPVPRTLRAASVEDLLRQGPQYPVVLKPAIKEHFFYAARVKALRAGSEPQLRARFAQVQRLIPAEEILVQELIPGGGERQFSYCAFFRDGTPVARMVVRRTRQHPPDFGRASTYVETVDLPFLHGPSESFLSEIGYYGLVEMEYKLDGRDGRYKLLDVNPRTWGYHSIGAAAGMDFPWILYCDQVGAAAEPGRVRPRIRWVRLATDIPAAAAEVLRGNLGLGALLASLFRSTTEAVFSWDDPLPAFAEIAHLPRLYLTRGGSRIPAAPGKTAAAQEPSPGSGEKTGRRDEERQEVVRVED